MAQDYNSPIIPLPSSKISAIRRLLNDGLDALRSCFSGATAPSQTTAYMLWADTTAGQMKQRNAADSAWVTLWTISSGPTALTVTTITATSATATAGGMFLLDASSNNVTLNLDPATGLSGQVLYIKRIDGTGNTVTIDPDASETIDGATTQTLASQYDSLTLVSDGTSFHII